MSDIGAEGQSVGRSVGGHDMVQLIVRIPIDHLL